jgi:hypothetical protein
MKELHEAKNEVYLRYQSLMKTNAKKYYEEHKDELREKARQNRVALKTAVLTHYGKDGKLQCCWPGCEVTDIDMLTLDHLLDNGAEHRKALSTTGQRNTGSSQIYNEAIANDFPPLFQTLCWNHQWKKQLSKRKI